MLRYQIEANRIKGALITILTFPPGGCDAFNANSVTNLFNRSADYYTVRHLSLIGFINSLGGPPR